MGTLVRQRSVGDVGVFICDGEGYIKLYHEQDPEDLAEFTDSCGSVHAQPVLVSYIPSYPTRPIRPAARFRAVGMFCDGKPF